MKEVTDYKAVVMTTEHVRYSLVDALTSGSCSECRLLKVNPKLSVGSNVNYSIIECAEVSGSVCWFPWLHSL